MTLHPVDASGDSYGKNSITQHPLAGLEKNSSSSNNQDQLTQKITSIAEDKKIFSGNQADIRAILDDLKGVVHSLERNPPTEEKAIMNLGIRNKIDEQFNKIKISISKIAREDGSLSNLINKAQAENATAIEKLEQIISTQKQQIVNSPAIPAGTLMIQLLTKVLTLQRHMGWE